MKLQKKVEGSGLWLQALNLSFEFQGLACCFWFWDVGFEGCILFLKIGFGVGLCTFDLRLRELELEP